MSSAKILEQPLDARCDRMIYGGSFDPPHRGHLTIIHYVLAQRLTPVIDLIPAAVSPFKTDAPPTAGAARRQLLEAAISDLLAGAGEFTDPNTAIQPEQIQLRTLELDRPPPSFTVDTCAALREIYPGQTLGLLIGSDSLRDFQRWTRVEGILAHHPVFVFRRAQESVADVRRLIDGLCAQFPPARFYPLTNPLVPCASSDIRAQIAAGQPEERARAESISRCLTPRVRGVIDELRLYR